MRQAVLASGLKEAAIKKLEQMGIEIITFHDNESVGCHVRNHADLSFLDYNDGTFFIAKEMSDYSEVIENLGYGVRILNENLGDRYPSDVLLNCVVIGKHLICNVDTVSSDVLQYFREKDIDIINVNQGYTKCSVIPVSDNSLITDDESIAVRCRNAGLDVLFVSKGSVRLDGFDYGFIGGTAGKLNSSEIVFNGDICTHDDGNKIVEFLSSYGVDAVLLADGQLYDVGSIIVLNRRNLNEKE